MAILLRGKSECPLCGKIIVEEEAILYTSFTSNAKDPLFMFSDAAVHTACNRHHKLGEKAMHYSEKAMFLTARVNRKCVVDQRLITDPDDHVFTCLLTSDESEELYDFNFITINRKNILRYSDRENFILAALKFNKEGKWGSISNFNFLDYLLTSFNFNKSFEK